MSIKSIFPSLQCLIIRLKLVLSIIAQIFHYRNILTNFQLSLLLISCIIATWLINETKLFLLLLIYNMLLLLSPGLISKGLLLISFNGSIAWTHNVFHPAKTPLINTYLVCSLYLGDNSSSIF